MANNGNFFSALLHLSQDRPIFVALRSDGYPPIRKDLRRLIVGMATRISRSVTTHLLLNLPLSTTQPPAAINYQNLPKKNKRKINVWIMSREGSNSHSESSNSSPNQALMMRDNNDFTDLTLFGSAVPVFSRTGTVRRATKKVDKEGSLNGEDVEVVHTKSPRASPELHPPTSAEGRYRKSLDSTYR
ncbi:hypothetical protein TcasGA2_TC006855 [Tribolium castaneum]|uniref:Uncharacterized protein n=1 Tax=Tribolium castaneum TaxID=7070 RepID=D7EJ82_TRICA|nr:hypothetical protein TcasGA2_TC006855 [Tribolium castaneum]